MSGYNRSIVTFVTSDLTSDYHQTPPMQRLGRWGLRLLGDREKEAHFSDDSIGSVTG